MECYSGNGFQACLVQQLLTVHSFPVWSLMPWCAGRSLQPRLSASAPGRLGARGGPCPRPESQHALSLQVIAELQGTVSSLREDSSRQQLAAERRLQDVVRKFEDEKQQLIREKERAVQVRRFRVAAGGRGSRGNRCPARLPASRALGSDAAGPARPRAHGDRHHKPSILTADTCLRAVPCPP